MYTTSCWLIGASSKRFALELRYVRIKVIRYCFDHLCRWSQASNNWKSTHCGHSTVSSQRITQLCRATQGSTHRFLREAALIFAFENLHTRKIFFTSFVWATKSIQCSSLPMWSRSRVKNYIMNRFNLLYTRTNKMARRTVWSWKRLIS